MKSINYQLNINASPQQLYNAILSEDAIKSWWTDDVSISRVEGTVAKFGFYDRSILLNFRIEILHKNSMVKWLCLEGPDEYINSKITFNLISVERGVKLIFEHTDLNGTEQFVNHATKSWKQVLDSLKSYVETGAGSPISM